MGRDSWRQALSKGKAVGCTASILFHPLRLRAVGLALALASVLARSPLGAACTCTVTATASQPTLLIGGTSSGGCERPTRVGLVIEGVDDLGVLDCQTPPTCIRPPFNTSISCLPTDVYTATALCSCGNYNASGGCVDDTGTASTTFFVHSTPMVDVISSEP